MEFFDVIHRRASVRTFQPHEIGEAAWETLLRAAMAAPSAVNCQPWEFVIIRAPETLNALAAALPYAKMAAQASGAVLVCARPDKAFQGSVDYAVIDASLACQNLLLAATALGLGAVWTAVHPDPVRAAAVRDLLDIPSGVIPLALVPIGQPAGTVEAKDKYRPELVHRERW